MIEGFSKKKQQQFGEVNARTIPEAIVDPLRKKIPGTKGVLAMRNNAKIILNALLLMILSVHPHCQGIFGQPVLSLLHMNVPFVSPAVMVKGEGTIFYELQLVNNSSDSILLRSLSVKVFSQTNAGDELSFEFHEDELLDRVAVRNHKTPRNLLSPGDSALLYMELSSELNFFTKGVHVMHNVNAYRLVNNMKSQFISKFNFEVPDEKAIVLKPPLRSGPWGAVYQPVWERGHRRVISKVRGKTYIPGRFAIDFIKLNNDGRYVEGEEDIVKNWFGYGEEVLAVGDGIVQSTRDDFSESKTLSAHPKYSPQEATGNYISIDLGNDHIAFYEHLKPESIRVKPGQRVKAGDVIALVGFTGQTTGPHLHFHIANYNSPLGADGIPFVFEKFILLGSFNYPDFGKTMWTPVRKKKRSTLEIKQERPGPHDVITFK